jgi:hypothetical protein
MSLLGLGLASAQVVHTPMTFTMDSPFYVGDKLLPAGAYYVLPVFSENNLLEIRGIAKGPGAFVWTLEKDNRETPASSLVTFDKCGNELFLNSVVVASESEAAIALPSRAEKRAIQDSGREAGVVIPAIPVARKG